MAFQTHDSVRTHGHNQKELVYQWGQSQKTKTADGGIVLGNVVLADIQSH